MRRSRLCSRARRGELSIAVTASGVLAQLVDRLRSGGTKELGTPRTLRALHWLVTMGSLGLGACLADAARRALRVHASTG